MNRFTPRPPPKVALLIETSNQYGRDLLYGIRDWVRGEGPWTIRFTEHGRRAPVPRWIFDWKGHGIIARVDSAAAAAALRRVALPVVDVSAERFDSRFPRVSVDNAAVAAMSGEHLAGKGFRHFAFCGDARFLWSRQRGAAYRRWLAERGMPLLPADRCEIGRESPGSDAEVRTIARWLKRLAKPVAVFAAYDGVAQRVLEACQMCALDVPAEVAVIGVDNDDVVCELCSPPLSSVLPNARRTGFAAAGILARMMRGEALESRTHQIPPLRVVERQSTDGVSVPDTKVAAAARFINDHAAEGIQVGDVLRAVPMSRTLFDRRFKELLGRSPHEHILRKKIERARGLLADSVLPISVVSELSGFGNPSYFSSVFGRVTGGSPRAYRLLHGSARPAPLASPLSNDM